MLRKSCMFFGARPTCHDSKLQGGEVDVDTSKNVELLLSYLEFVKP